MTFGEKLHQARLTLDITQAELAKKTGISERSLYTYEQQGIIPRKGNIKKLADALHVSETYLLDENETDPGADLEREAFIEDAREKFGERGARQAVEVLEKTAALFAGGDLDDDAKEVFMRSLMEVYMKSKEEASEKFTPDSVRRKQRRTVRHKKRTEG